MSTDEAGFLLEVARSTTSSRSLARRPFLSDSDLRAVVRLPEDWEADAVLAALRDPVFPLYLGRTHCLPSEEIGETVIEADSLELALAELPAGTRYLPLAGFDPLSVEVPPRGAAAALYGSMMLVGFWRAWFRDGNHGFAEWCCSHAWVIRECCRVPDTDICCSHVRVGDPSAPNCRVTLSLSFPRTRG